MTSEQSEPEQGDAPSPAAIAATEHPVQITVGLLDDERVPEGMVCMGSYRNGRLIARAVLPPEAWGQIHEYGVFDEPVQIVLVARAASPGLQCQLYAMVPLPDAEDDEPDEPWSASVPGSSYESSVEEEDEVFVQADFEDELKRATLWGKNAACTAAAVEVFMTQGHLEDLLGRIWRFRVGVFV